MRQEWRYLSQTGQPKCIHYPDNLSFSPRYGGNLNTAKEDFGLATIGGQEDKKVISFGGNGFDYLSSVEEWDEDTEEWKLAPYSLEESKDGFASLAVPPEMVCPQTTD